MRQQGESYRPARCTVWWQRPDKWRDDYQFAGGSWVRSVYSGSTGAAYLSYPKKLIFEEFLGTNAEGRRLPDLKGRIEAIYVLDENFLSDGWETQLGTQTTRLGRDALLIHARPLGPESLRRGNPPLIDRWELVMDRSTGIILSAEGFQAAEKVIDLKVTAMSTDTPVPERTFSLDPADLSAAPQSVP